MDLYFFKKHFNFPYYLPAKFTDEALKNKTISVRRYPNAQKDDKNNWKHTYTHDSFGRLTSYAFSDCFSCSSLPYNYSVTYNKDGRVEAFTETINNMESFRCYYNAKGDIVKLEKYLFGKLRAEVVN